ncbi:MULTISPECIES: phosphoserine phosphatase SerB [Bartonella]|uniref:phosphoserine phosphatase SerB n=1 Tax=Bartonella TaxID=773 RepID=UPI0018DDD059|nr:MULTISPECIES: phosphoserine phosphatase SerB [Bartonella]MBH9975308.1 phosphoserine phosphatase SerB [Bartonella choladocola]MBI0014915.1 phosphoserine phosphatase SerB [Bartonella sp. B10834G3]
MSHSELLVATLIANPEKPVLTPQLVDKATDSINASNVYWLCDGIACDIPLNNNIAPDEARATLRNTLHGEAVDVAVQRQDNRRKKLLIADMDSTMIGQECIDELADVAGLRDYISDITKRAMNGEIAFEPALRERVALLKGLPLSIIDDVIEKRITLANGGKALIATMRKNGAYTALVSGGFTLFTSKIASAIGFDEHNANELVVEGDHLAGRVNEPILGKQAKLEKLEELCERLHISPDDAMAVGDGANDLAMLQRAGSGVALHAKPIVAEAASIRIDYGDLTALLYLQGYRKSDFVE